MLNLSALALLAASTQAQSAAAITPLSADQQAKAESTAAPAANSDLPAVETIITDEAFAGAVPSLDPTDDPELDAPLESIGQFEQRLAQGAAERGGQTLPEVPVLAGGVPDEETADAPIRDAQLTAPLMPLDQFEVEPVDFAEAEATSEEKSLAYALEINGLEEVTRLSSADMLSTFKNLSALRNGGREAANAAMVEARLTEDAELVKTILASEGWYDAQVKTRIALQAKPLTAIIDVVPGERFVFSTITVDAPPTTPADLIRSNLALAAGRPIIAERVQGAEAQITILLPEYGYAFAEIGDRSILLDRETAEGAYLLPVSTGPRARFGGFRTEGDLAFGAEHVDVLARFEQGELYDSLQVDDLRKALVATGLLSTVSVQPERTGQDAGDGTEYVTMLVNQQAGPPRTIAGSAGYGTGEGFRLEASWAHRNMFAPEGALILSGVAGTKEQGAEATFRRSNAGRRDLTFELTAQALHSNFDAYSAYTGRLAGQFRYSSTPIWQKRFTYAFGAEFLATSERSYDFDLGRNDRQTYYIAGLNGQAGLDYTDDLMDPTRGFRARVHARPEGSLGGGFNLYLKSQIDASAYLPIGDSLVAAGRVRLGTIQGAKLDDIAPSRRFFAGGGGSVRGYAYQKLGSLDPEGDPVGGRSLNEASAELRYRFGDFGVAGFVDAGQSYTQNMPQFSDIRFGAGIGARYYTNFGPLRIDLATPINRRPGESRINIYVSIGQAF